MQEEDAPKMKTKYFLKTINHLYQILISMKYKNLNNYETKKLKLKNINCFR